MLEMSLLKNVEIVKCLNYTAAGTSDTLSGAILDMQGHDGVCFVAALGDITSGAVLTLAAQDGAASNLSDAAAITGAGALTAGASDYDNKLLVLDVYRPKKRYIRATLARATQNAVVENIVALLYNVKSKPVTQGSTVKSGTQVVSPTSA